MLQATNHKSKSTISPKKSQKKFVFQYEAPYGEVLDRKLTYTTSITMTFKPTLFLQPSLSSLCPPQNIVKNLERQEVRDWLSNTRDILTAEKKVS